MKTVAAILMLLLAFGLVINPLNSEPLKTSVPTFPIIKKHLQTGDLVFRKGKGIISDFFAQASESEKLYSHVGVLVMKNEIPYVYHLLGTGESGKSGLKIETLSSFCNGSQNNGFALYRNKNLGGKPDLVESYLEAVNKSRVVFDEHFDLATDDEQYCTEMIYKMILSLTGKQLPISIFKGQQFVSIDNLYFNTPECHLIYKHTYSEIQ